MDCGKIGFALIAALGGCLHAQSIAGCPVLPADNVWNTAIDKLPVDSNSPTYVQTIGAARHFHSDFGAGATLGIPFVVVPGNGHE